MAGSFAHIQHGWSLIENMGDAAECAEELLWLVLRLTTDREANRLLNQEFYPMKRGESPKDEILLDVESKMDR